MELECEKAFLLMTCTKSTGDINFLGLLKIQKILNMPEGLETLEKKYEFQVERVLSRNTGFVIFIVIILQMKYKT